MSYPVVNLFRQTRTTTLINHLLSELAIISEWRGLGFACDAVAPISMITLLVNNVVWTSAHFDNKGVSAHQSSHSKRCKHNLTASAKGYVESRKRRQRHRRHRIMCLLFNLEAMISHQSSAKTSPPMQAAVDHLQHRVTVGVKAAMATIRRAACSSICSANVINVALQTRKGYGIVQGVVKH